MYLLIFFKWTYRAANSWGTDPDGTGCIGCGPQEHFRACADISIEGDGSEAPETTTPQAQVTTTEAAPDATTASPTEAPCTDGGSFKRVCCKFENYPLIPTPNIVLYD